MRGAFTWLLNQLLPPACPLCCTTLPPGWAEPFCQGCLQGFPRLPDAHCPRCAIPFTTSHGNPHLCGRCLTTPPAFVRTRCVGLYEGALRQAVHRFKYRQGIALDRPLARLLERAVGNETAFDLIVPVPLHRNRLRRRRYNQALLLATELARLQNRPMSSNVLIKQRDTLAQQGLSARDREKNLKQAFICTKKLDGEKILLVDDVMTTGATANACSRSLLESGAKEVSFASLGRALPPSGR